MHIKNHKVNDFLDDTDWKQLIGNQENFITLTYAVLALKNFNS